ncbi:right-handed parallel beta-helix repeat-containing protein [Echinicola sediminis]
MKFAQALALLFFSTLFSAFSQQEIHVSPSGQTKAKGNLKNPTTLQQAIKTLERKSSSMKSDIIVYLHDGRYQLDAPLLLSEKHSGNNGFNVIFKAYENEQPVISGGVKISNWENAGGNIYKAKLHRQTKLRSLFVNGKRMRMAGTEVPVAGLGDWGTFEIKGDEDWAFGAGSGIEGIKFSSSDIAQYSHPEDIELVQFNIWTEKILCAREVERFGDTTVIKFQQPYGAIATSMAWAGKINYNKNFVIRNAKELLDTPGEFYFDKSEQTLYYYSSGEDMAKAEVIAPSSQGLIRIKGSSTASKAGNIKFEGITFSHDDWQLMEVADSHGFAGIQSLGLAVKYIPGGNWHPSQYNSTDVPRGAIDVQNVANVVFDRNRFEKIGSAIAINMVNDVKNAEVTGNTFHDLLGNAVNIGHPQHYQIGDGSLFGPEEEGLCEDILVSNNYLRNICLDFRQVEGITAFFVANTRIEHNDIAWTPYGAITCGWWWGNAEIPPSTVAKNNHIRFNKAGNSHQVLDDGGIIYVLGEQPNSTIKGNYVFNGPRCIYPDDGSAYWTISENVVGNPSYKWMWLHLWTKRCHDITAQDNYVKNNLLMDNGTNNTITNTYSFREDEFSGKALEIMENAGIQKAYKDIIPAQKPEKINIFPKDFKESDRFH